MKCCKNASPVRKSQSENQNLARLQELLALEDQRQQLPTNTM